MDGELVTAIVSVAAVATGVLGYVGRELKYRHEERQAAKRTPEPINGKYITHEVLTEHCEGEMRVITSKIDSITERQDNSVRAVDKLTESIYRWKDEAVEKLADHGARIGALERNGHGTRG